MSEKNLLEAFRGKKMNNGRVKKQREIICEGCILKDTSTRSLGKRVIGGWLDLSTIHACDQDKEGPVTPRLALI